MCPKNAKSTIDIVANMSVLINLVLVLVFTMKISTRNWSGHLFIQNIQQFFFLPFLFEAAHVQSDVLIIVADGPLVGSIC